MSDKKTEVELKVSETISTLADRIRKDLKIGEGGVIATDKEFYQKYLPEDVSMADVQRVQSHDSNFLSAVGLAVGEMGLKHFEKHKSADSVSLSYGAGKNEFSVNFARSKQVPDGKGKGEMTTKYGVLSAKATVSGAVGSRGSLNKIRQYLSGQGAASLGG